MSENIDSILDSGCLEKLLESEKEISSKEELSAYLDENGFSEISDEDLKNIFSQIEQLTSSGGGSFSVDTGVNKTKFSGKGVNQTCGVNVL